MQETYDPLVADLVEWVAAESRAYREVMEAWRTSCPRLTVWEDAIEQGLVERVMAGSETRVQVTPSGRAWLAKVRPAAA